MLGDKADSNISLTTSSLLGFVSNLFPTEIIPPFTIWVQTLQTLRQIDQLSAPYCRMWILLTQKCSFGWEF